MGMVCSLVLSCLFPISLCLCSNNSGPTKFRNKRCSNSNYVCNYLFGRTAPALPEVLPKKVVDAVLLFQGNASWRFPRWSGPPMSFLAVSLFHVGLPWFLSTLHIRFGWFGQSPGVWNMLGLSLVVAGFGLLVWALILHFLSAKEGWDVELAPSYLIMRGPYRWTRNPMYIAAFAIWLGWAIFYGSLVVAGGLLLLSSFLVFVQVPMEERALEKRFGDGYRQFRDQVPRWVLSLRHRKRG